MMDDLSLQACARLLVRDKVILRARDYETREILGVLTITVTERDADGLPVKVAVEQEAS